VFREAVEYMMRGWQVFPTYGKVPATPHGFLDASSAIEDAERWWGMLSDEGPIMERSAKDRSTGIAIATGKASNLLVLDVDGNSGTRSLERLLVEGKREKLYPSPTVKTRRGFHFYFALNSNISARSLVNWEPGLDVRADGGYVVAPPSLHPAGGAYGWVEGRSPADVELPEAPEWLLRGAERKPLFGRDGGWYAEKGARNWELLRLAGVLRSAGLGYREIAACLLAVNQERCRPPVSEGEVRSVVESACKWPEGPVVFGEAA
jgi:putative DNA primase/helicase